MVTQFDPANGFGPVDTALPPPRPSRMDLARIHRWRLRVRRETHRARRLDPPHLRRSSQCQLCQHVRIPGAARRFCLDWHRRGVCGSIRATIGSSRRFRGLAEYRNPGGYGRISRSTSRIRARVLSKRACSATGSCLSTIIGVSAPTQRCAIRNCPREIIVLKSLPRRAPGGPIRFHRREWFPDAVAAVDCARPGRRWMPGLVVVAQAAFAPQLPRSRYVLGGEAAVSGGASISGDAARRPRIGPATCLTIASS